MLLGKPLEEMIACLPFWGELSEADQRALADAAYIVSYRAGDAVLSGAQNCLGILVLRSGRLRTYALSEDGKEVTLFRQLPGECCTLTASCIIKNITFDVYIDAERDSDVFIIQPDVFDRVQRKYAAVATFINEAINQRFSDVMWVMEQVMFMRFDRRLAIFLIDQTALDDSDMLALTHDMIAKHMGTAREVVSRMLKYFEQEGLVQLWRGGVTVIDKRALRALT